MVVAVSLLSPGTVIIPQNKPRETLTGKQTYHASTEQSPVKAAWETVFPDSISLFTAALVIATVALFYATMRIARDTKASGIVQADKMERSATAMEGVKESMAINAKQIVRSVEQQELFGRMHMRAYVSVMLDERPVYQEGKLRFQAKPSLRNTGHTPAQKLRWRINGAIETVPLPPDFDFSLPPPRPGENILMPQVGVTLDFVLPGCLVDELVPEVMLGNGWAFYVWGIVSYNDVFAAPHETKFAHVYSWIPTGEVREDGLRTVLFKGMYLPMHNEAN